MLPPREADEEDNIEFRWGHKMGVGDKNEDVQLYASFTYDGVEYFLYDCVYMWRDNELDIGKIVRIWQTASHEKKVKVVWFFRPIEIQQWLGDGERLRNEIFLASGEGKGLFNYNLLEAICGKCNVVCTSKDKRNPQASEEELRVADYIFYRTFDVATCTISPDFADVIAGTEVKHFFNPKKDQKLITSKFKGKIAKPSSILKVEGVTVSRKPFKDVKIDTSPKPAANDKAESKRVNNLSPTSLSDIESRKNRKVHSDKAELKRVQNLSPTSLSDIESRKRGKVQSGGPTEDPAKFSDTLPRVPDPPDSVKNLTHFDGGKGSNSDCQFLEVARRPAVQSSNWFGQKSWMEKIKSAYERGSLVLLENLDPSYTSSDVEDIVWSAFKVVGEAMMVPRRAFSSPRHGQAFFIFKSMDAAELAISELKGRCLMLSNGRPLVGRKGCPAEPNNPSRLAGHLVIGKPKFQKQSTDWKIAVSTSHFSQPNTMEYDMALEWLVLREKSKLWWDALNKQQAKEIEQVRSRLKIHHNE